MSADNYFALAESSPHPTFGLDLGSLKLVYGNQAFERLFNVETASGSEQIILANIPHEDQQYLKHIYEKLLKGSVEPVEFQIKLKDDHFSCFKVIPLVVQTDTKKLLLGNVFDVTAEVRNLHTFIKYANKKDSILNILAHDLTGHLHIANTLTELLNKEITDPRLNDMVVSIIKITTDAIALIKDLTNREFLETKDVDLVKKRINIAKKLKEYIEECQRSEALTKRTFKFFSSQEDVFIMLDEAKFIQIINNLTSNALKFTSDYGVISLTIEDHDEFVMFTMADDGIGIPHELHSQLFDRFTEAGRKGLKGEPTIGLGLFVVKTIVEWHGGKIWVENSESGGTTFHISIPKNQ